ncbi:DEAD/DEAH box helicase [Lactobacillaceae bacterium 24-114]
MADIIKDAILNGLYSTNYSGDQTIAPQIVTNSSSSTIWEMIRNELLSCEKFVWSVAFVTEDMLVPLKLVLADLANKGISGELITGTYLNFNSPKVFRELLKIPNLRVRINEKDGFHTKAYLFQHEDYITICMGSANFTRSAMLSNYETLLKISSTMNGSLAENLVHYEEELRKFSHLLTEGWVEKYEQSWVKPTPHEIKRTTKRIAPNQMQQSALAALWEKQENGAKRSLIISATGTGKTYLSAFAVKEYNPKRFLYIVHREQIAKKSLNSFQEVIGGSKEDFGLLNGNNHQLDCRYLFATVQTLSQEKILEKLPEDQFDYILIDEAHRTPAPSYQRIMKHFKPKFWLGLTATPERMDNQDVFKLFDYHVAYEVRLKDALDANMLSPFHYVGIQDYEADGEIISETTQLNRLVATDRVKYILQQLDYYGYCGEQPRGLIFCSRQEEAKEIAHHFSVASHPAVALTNNDSGKRRQEVVAKLEQGELEYIVTVNLFNEGIDIPSVNQVIFLRNTQSKTVFLQQLGRGLRKYPGKDYVTVIDFIGNYKHNYLVPLALNDDTSCDRDQARQEIRFPPKINISTINFSQIASEHILASLAETKLDSMVELRKAFHQLNQRIGRIPLLQDFFDSGLIDPQVFVNHPLLPHYGTFLMKMGEKVRLSQWESELLSFVTKELANGKRPHELILLKKLIESNGELTKTHYQQEMKQRGVYVNDDVLKSVIDILSLNFFTVKSGKKLKKEMYGNRPIVKIMENKYQLLPAISQSLQNNQDFYKLMLDAINVGLALSKGYDWGKQFTLYRRYNRKDVCRLLNWPLDVSAPMYGYRVSEEECPIFITYRKDSKKERNANYNNQFQDGRSLRWYTRSPRHLDSTEVQKLLQGVDKNKQQIKIHVFVKQSDAAGKDFYYLGEAKIEPKSVREEIVGKKAAVGMDLVLKDPLPTKINNLLFK